jgi:pimeloyl-ACP methyl ester carboxylesterase
MKRLLIRLLVILGIMGIGLPVFLLALSFTVNRVALWEESRTLPPPGILVAVGEGRMHLFREGFGGPAVVLMSGLGCPSPYVDYRSLAERLALDRAVVQVENFGYGWSDGTAAPRSAAAIVEETRSALKTAGIYPPYILVPHSIAGLYALEWARKHPGELAGVVGLDTSAPEQLKHLGEPKVAPWLGPGAASGVLRLLLWGEKTWFAADGDRPVPGSREARLAAIGFAMACRNSGNPTIEDETRRFAPNANGLAGAKFPAGLDVRFVLSDQVVAVGDKAGWKDGWVAMHERQLEGPAAGRVRVLPGSHSIHTGNEEAIRAIVNEVADGHGGLR